MNKKTDRDNRYFRSSDFQLCNFLYAQSQKLVNVDSLESGIKEFVFLNNDRLQELENKYRFGDKDDPDLLMQVHIYEEARRQLLSFIKDNGFGRKF